MISLVRKAVTALLLVMGSSNLYAHYPILDCRYEAHSNAIEMIVCEASFSDRSKAPNVLMEVISEDDEIILSGKTDEASVFRFERPEGGFFIIMDAGPGHVLEISNEEVVEI
ncbi:hypothetical protein MIB92_18040 [Aestuariirhabdus sp. Z084]|uniref:hypothetical protein n=1 Tax=Aestuariirhabdus haliotis TaxID=2918751 RepID=UPI00201B3D3C|nr:hypothetical protein [Aestuariirhabdus haliotis]MCL6417567.1 hypothetical protein [Aestuariirhabdus haliotis]MCL6420591.1 hypothetical protein [Aestuariirhabdus haliotis]